MNDSQKIDSQIGKYLTAAQYMVGPVQAHVHNGIDSQPVNFADLANPLVISGVGAPPVAAPLLVRPVGTLYVNTTAVTSITRLYIAIDAAGTWAYIQVSA